MIVKSEEPADLISPPLTVTLPESFAPVALASTKPPSIIFTVLPAAPTVPDTFTIASALLRPSLPMVIFVAEIEPESHIIEARNQE